MLGLSRLVCVFRGCDSCWCLLITGLDVLHTLVMNLSDFVLFRFDSWGIWFGCFCAWVLLLLFGAYCGDLAVYCFVDELYGICFVVVGYCGMFELC